MEMQQVRYFLALARTLHFSRAAEECNVTQPALSRAIQSLEAEFGGELNDSPNKSKKGACGRKITARFAHLS
jgi:DNA-binding transcriptional LysR family regulator